VPLTIQLHSSERQTAFNLNRWRELLADPELARLPHRIETDRHGRILMSPLDLRPVNPPVLLFRCAGSPSIVRDVSGASATD
jgi:hypothetical protein